MIDKSVDKSVQFFLQSTGARALNKMLRRKAPAKTCFWNVRVIADTWGRTGTGWLNFVQLLCKKKSANPGLKRLTKRVSSFFAQTNRISVILNTYLLFIACCRLKCLAKNNDGHATSIGHILWSRLGETYRALLSEFKTIARWIAELHWIGVIRWVCRLPFAICSCNKAPAAAYWKALSENITRKVIHKSELTITLIVWRLIVSF